MAGKTFDCSVDQCGYTTPVCETEVTVLALLQLHQANVHTPPAAAERRDRLDKSWQPERLELEPTEANEAEYKFWKKGSKNFCKDAALPTK